MTGTLSHRELWHNRLSASSRPCAIILRESLEKENCIPKDVMEAFFVDVVAAVKHVNEKGLNWDAVDIAHKVVSSNKKKYTFLGPKVPGHRFQVALRFIKAEELSRVIPRQFARSGCSLSDVHKISDEHFERAFGIVTEPLRLGNRLDIVWVTEATRIVERFGIKDISSAKRKQGQHVYKELGLSNNEPGPLRAFLATYRPRELNLDLKIPRVFDAIGAQVFKLETSTRAESGHTVPLLPGADGLPEAIHRRATITPDEWVWVWRQQ